MSPSRIPFPLLLACVTACSTAPNHDLVRERTRALFDVSSTDRAPEPGNATRPSPEDVLATADLDLFVRYGLHENGALRAAYERWRAALERVASDSSLPDPVFSFMHFVEEIQTRTGPQERRYSLSQTFPWFGKLDSRGAVATSAAEEAWNRVLKERLRVERDIAVAFYEYAYLAQSIRITRENLELLQQLEPIVRQRIVGGTSGQRDLTRIQVEVGRIENELASLQQFRPALSARLAAAMNWRRHEPLPMPELTEPMIRDVDVATLAQEVERSNPELLELAARVQTNRDARDLAALQKWPDVTVGVDYFETDDAAGPVSGSGDDPLGVHLMFNLPIWRGKYDAAEREAERRMYAARHALGDRRATLRSDLELAAFQLEDAARQVVLYRETLLPRARESLEVTRTAYRSGSATILEVIDTERALLEFETGYWRACRDHFQSEARLQSILGGDL